MTVPARMLRAYRRTVYTAAGVEVRIGRRSPAMDTLLRRHGARWGVFVTAWNPFSRRMPEGWNARMQTALATRLRRAIVVPADGCWRGWWEAHLLVLASPQPVLGLALRFRQRAVVVVGRGQRARLVMAVRGTHR